MKDQISSGEETQGLVPAPWEALEEALNRKERRSTSFIWYSIAAGVLLVFSAAVVYLGLGTNATKTSAESNIQTAAPTTSPTNSDATTADITTSDITTSAPTNTATSNTATSTSAVTSSELSTSVPITSVPTTSVSPATSAVPSNSIVSTSVDVLAVAAEPLSDHLTGTAWMLDAAGFDIQAVELGSEFYLAQADLAKLNKEFERSDLSRGSLSMLSSSANLGNWWLEVSADQNQTGLNYYTPVDLSQYVHKNFENQMKQGETALSAARFQLAINRFVTKSSSVKIGLAYTQNRVGQNFNFRDSMPAVVSAGQTPDANGNYPIFGYLGLGPEVKYNGSIQYSFLSVPIGWSGYMPIANSKTLFFTPEVLIQPNWVQLSSGAQTLDYQTLLLKPMDAVNYRAWVMSARVAAGIQKRLNYQHAIGAKWNAQGVLNSMNTANSPIQTRGWSSGLTLYYSFKID